MNNYRLRLNFFSGHQPVKQLARPEPGLIDIQSYTRQGRIGNTAYLVIVIYAGTDVLFSDPVVPLEISGNMVNEIAKNLNERGNAVVMITHDMELVTRYSHRTIVLGNGEVILDGPTHEVFEKPDVLQTTYLKPPQIGQLAQALEKQGVYKDIITVDEFKESLSFRK